MSTEVQKKHNNIAQNIDSIRKPNRSHSIASTIDDNPKKDFDDSHISPIQSRKSSIVNNIFLNNASLKEANGKSNHSDDETSKKFDNNNKKKEKSFSRRNSSDLEDESKADRDEVDKYFISTLKRTSIHDHDDDETEQNISNNNVGNKKDNDFDYDFGEKDDENEDEKDDGFDQLLTQTISNKRFQNKNFNRTLKFDAHSEGEEDESEDNEETSATPKPAPRKMKDDSDSDSF
jgi:hypothetical protein